MAAGFSIVISATDSASKTIDGVNKRIAAMQAPTQRLQKSLDRFGELSGIKTLSKGFEDVSRHALSSFLAVARMVPPLAAITSAASLAGMADLVSSWDQFGSKLGFASARINVAASRLQSLEGAAQLAGASSGTLTSGLMSLGTVMNDAVGGRAPEAVALFNQLGIAFQDGSRHALNVTQVLPKLADSIASMRDPFQQARVATKFFGGAAEDLLPFLRSGAAGLAEYTAKAKAYGVMTQAGVEAANRLRQSQVGVSLAVQGLTNSIAERLAPILTPILDQMANWVAINRDWISTDIGDEVKQFAIWVETIDFKSKIAEVEDFGTRAKSVVDALGGWKTVLEGIIAIKFSGFLSGAIGPVVSLLRLLALVPAAVEVAAVKVADLAVGKVGTQADVRNDHTGIGKWIYDSSSALRYADNWLHGTGDARQERLSSAQVATNQSQAMNSLMNMGYSESQAAGLVANFSAESGLNPGLTGDSGQAYGIGQWHPDRQALFAKRFGHSIVGSSLGEQLQFSDYELHTTERGALGHLQTAGSASAAGDAVSRYYERPRAVDDAAFNRAQLATDLFNNFKPGEGAPGASGKVDVNVKVSTDGAPAKVTSKSSGGVSQPKIAMAGVGAGGL